MPRHATEPSFDFQNLRVANARYADAMKRAAAEVIDSGRYLNGERNRQLCTDLATLCHTATAISTDCGLNALRLIYHAYMVLGRLAPGDEVIMPANTFIATLLPATHLGLKIRPVDPDPDTFGLDLRQAEQHLSPTTRMVVSTHLYGTPSWDFEAAARLRARGIILVEDAAQAIGASIGGQPVGSLGDAAAFSFYPAKNIGALGDAGAVVTSDTILADTIRALANYGSPRRYYSDLPGYNSRMDEMQAAFLSIKLADLDNVVAERRAAAEAYDRHIDNPLIQKPAILADRLQVWHQYVVRCPRRDDLQQYLASHGVETLIHYPVPPHLQKCYEGEFTGCCLPVTEQMAQTVLSLPIADRTGQDIKQIANIINRFL